MPSIISSKLSIRKPTMEEEEGAIYEEEILAAEDGRIVDEFAKSLLKFVIRQQAEVLHAKFAKFLLKIISRQQALVPADLVANFLMNMGVESVYSFRRVSRLWRSTISNPAFIREHYHRSTKDLSNYRIVYKCFTKEYGYHLRSFDFQSVLNGEPIGGHPIPSSSSISIVGTCYGTVCVDKYGENLEILNLTTKRSWSLPDWHSVASYSTKFLDHPVMNVSGFGFIESTGDYVVLGVSSLSRRDLKMLLFRSNKGIWNLLRDPTQFPSRIIFASDRFHWFGASDILCLDVENEQYTSIELPKYSEPERDRDFTLGKLNDCVSVICGHGRNHDVWVLEKNGWTKMFTFERSWGDESDTYYLQPMCILPNGNLLLRFLHATPSLFVYDVGNGTWRMLQVPGAVPYPEVADFYVESMLG